MECVRLEREWKLLHWNHVLEPLIFLWKVTISFKEFDSSLAAEVAMAPSDSGFDPRQRRHLIRAQLVSQLIRVQLVLFDWGSNQQNL